MPAKWRTTFQPEGEISSNPMIAQKTHTLGLTTKTRRARRSTKRSRSDSFYLQAFVLWLCRGVTHLFPKKAKTHRRKTTLSGFSSCVFEPFVSSW